MRSVLGQSYQNIELIIVDDGSTDDTIKILGNIEDTRLKIVHGTHAGVSAARTLGVRKARGDLIAFLDSDDEFLPTKIEVAVAAFKSNPNAVMVYSYWLEKTDQHLEILKPYAEGDVRHDLLMFAPFSITTVVFRRAVLSAIAEMFDEDLAVCEDYDFLGRVAQNGECVLVREPLTLVHIHGHNTARDAARIYAARRYVIGKAFASGVRGVASRGVYNINSSMLRRMKR
jgi:glycosyltransferase involved in cell wall biosynthesis